MTGLGTTAPRLGRLRPGDTDWRSLVEALESEHLPADDLEEPGRSFFRIERDGEAVGFGGYELLGEDALLRSVVVRPGLRGQGLGREVAEAVLRAAAEAGARRAWLLTTSAAPFFERLGFARIDRSAAPASVQATRQAASLCPSSAALLMRPLAAGA